MRHIAAVFTGEVINNIKKKKMLLLNSRYCPLLCYIGLAMTSSSHQNTYYTPQMLTRLRSARVPVSLLTAIIAGLSYVRV